MNELKHETDLNVLSEVGVIDKHFSLEVLEILALENPRLKGARGSCRLLSDRNSTRNKTTRRLIVRSTTTNSAIEPTASTGDC